MLKNKATFAITGIMTLVGALGGTALIASAQGSTTTNTPAALTSPVAINTANSQESADDPVDGQGISDTQDTGGKTDADNIQDGDHQVGEHQDADGGTAGEGAETP